MGCSQSRKIQFTKLRVEIVALIAEGGFSYVYKVKGSDYNVYALKQIKCQTMESLQDATNEIKAHTIFKGSINIIQLIDSKVLEDKNNSMAYLLFPCYSRGSLFDIIESSRTDTTIPWPFHEERILKIISGICNGLREMHNKGFAHFDLKPHNILLTDDEDNPLPIIMDLGSVMEFPIHINSRKDGDKFQDIVSINCSAAYRSPELHYVESHCTIDGKVDVWSLGCILYALAFGHCPFESPTEGLLVLSIMGGNVSFPKQLRYRGIEFSEGFGILIINMLNADPSKRLTLSSVIQCVDRLQKGLSLDETILADLFVDLDPRS